MTPVRNTQTSPLMRPQYPPNTLAVLISGGVDSAVLLAEEATRRPVVPIYIRSGLAWENVELAYCQEFIQRIKAELVFPLVILEQPTADLYGAHWSTGTGQVPDDQSPDEAVFLPGRNLLLLCKSLLFCHLQGIREIALAPLAGNPFPDASPGFFSDLAKLVDQAIGTGAVRVLLPFRHLNKADVLRRGSNFPLDWTFSCIHPVDGKHCGRCNKCHERHVAFLAVGIQDPTTYFQPPQEFPCTA